VPIAALQHVCSSPRAWMPALEKESRR